MSAPEKPRRYRTPNKRLLARRDRVAWLVAKGKTAPEIVKALQKEDPEGHKKLTPKMIYEDVEVIKANSPQYIAMRFLPELGHHFEVTARNLQMIIREAWRRYEDGEIEEHHTSKETKDGTFEVTTEIRKEGSAEWLRLAGMASMALFKLSDHGMVTKEAAKVMAHYKELLEKDKRGALPVAPVQPGF